MSSNWENHFEDALTMKKSNHVHDDESLEMTIRPRRKSTIAEQDSGSEAQPTSKSSPKKHSGRGSQKPKAQGKGLVGNKFELPARPDLAFREQSVEDYSDLFDDNDGVFNQRLGLMKKVRVFPGLLLGCVLTYFSQPDAPQLFHPSDLASLPRSTQSPVSSSVRRQTASRPSILPDRPLQRAQSSIEIQKFAEDEGDEDFSDVFGPGDNLTEKDDSDRGSEDGGALMVISKLSSGSWLGDDEDEDDPFASIDPHWDEMNLEANIARDRHARLTEKVEELVQSLKKTEGEDALFELSEDLVGAFWCM